LRQEEEFEQTCRRESLKEKAAEIEKTISVKEHGRERHDFDPTMFYENCFLESEVRWHSDYQKSSNTQMIHPRVHTVI
jgi:hypothetical protein